MQKDEFEAVYTRYYRVVYAYLISLCRDESLAAELTQETFFKALKAIDRFDGRCPVNVWLCRIAKNALVDAARKASRTAPAEARPGRRPRPKGRDPRRGHAGPPGAAPPTRPLPGGVLAAGLWRAELCRHRPPV